ncbi:MAG: AMP-binding protein [Burkholderiales bacterium]|nr:MAG: AMP-binding protein [Burkholderiales bacterium]
MGERKLWNAAIEEMPPGQLRGLQLERLRAQVAYNYAGSLHYREKMDAAGIAPADIRTLEDYAHVPLMDKDEHRRVQERSLAEFGSPYALLACAPADRIVRISATSGTTGMPTLYTVTAHDVGVVNEMHARKYWRAGIRPGHTMLQAVSLSMFTGGLPLSDGIQHLGACVVPVGIEGGTRRVLEFAQLTRPHALIATPSFGLYLIDECRKAGGRSARDLGFRWFFCVGEPGGGNPTIRRQLADGFGARVFDHTGGGHAFHGISCDEPPDEYKGMHFVSPDHCLLEIVDPHKRQPIEMTDGAVGEMVFSFIDWEGGPLMRYALGDLLQVWTAPCPCGMPGVRFKIVGRTDDMLIVKGANVYPEAIRKLLLEFAPRVTGHFRIRLRRPGPAVDPPLRLRVETSEADPSALESELIARFRAELRIAPAIEWLAPETLPREAHKTKYIEIEGS